MSDIGPCESEKQNLWDKPEKLPNFTRRMSGAFVLIFLLRSENILRYYFLIFRTNHQLGKD
jgi:hypothetical protein